MGYKPCRDQALNLEFACVGQPPGFKPGVETIFCHFWSTFSILLIEMIDRKKAIYLFRYLMIFFLFLPLARYITYKPGERAVLWL